MNSVWAENSGDYFIYKPFNLLIYYVDHSKANQGIAKSDW